MAIKNGLSTNGATDSGILGYRFHGYVEIDLNSQMVREECWDDIKHGWLRNPPQMEVSRGKLSIFKWWIFQHAMLDY